MIIDFASPHDVGKWILKANDLNDRAFREMEETILLLRDIRTESTGPMVDEICHVSDNLFNLSRIIHSTIALITEAVQTVVKDMTNTVDDVSHYIRSVSRIFN